MPWWWGSDAQKPNTGLSDTTSNTSEAPSQPQASSRRVTDKPVGTTQGDSRTEEELAQFLPIFADSQRQELSGSLNQTSTSENASEKQIPPSRHRTDPAIATFPGTMSCRQAFDDAFYCQSLGGQFNNVYRYGSLKDCSEHWSQFWFCMRIKSKPEGQKMEMVQDWYRNKEARYKAGPSSEDIWEERKERVQRAFDWDPDKAGILEKGGER